MTRVWCSVGVLPMCSRGWGQPIPRVVKSNPRCRSMPLPRHANSSRAFVSVLQPAPPGSSRESPGGRTWLQCAERCFLGPALLGTQCLLPRHPMASTWRSSSPSTLSLSDRIASPEGGSTCMWPSICEPRMKHRSFMEQFMRWSGDQGGPCHAMVRGPGRPLFNTEKCRHTPLRLHLGPDS